MTEDVILNVREILKSGKHRDRGLCEFAAVPQRGDRVVLCGPGGNLDITEVLYLEHSPIELPRDEVLDKERRPRATVFVEVREIFAG